MKFFNKKEDVLDIKLTTYGRHLLSLGKFDPVYYAFYDDGVIYDSQHAGFGEEQNDTETRIQNQTPTLKTQHCFSGAEKRVTQEIVRQEVPDRIHSLNGLLGNSDLSSNRAPAWDLNFYQGKVEGESHILSGSTIPNQEIPQIDIMCTYKSYMLDFKKVDPIDLDKEAILEGSDPNSTRIAPDGTFIRIVPEDLLIDINEENTEYLRDNYDIEVFLVEETTEIEGVVEKLLPLLFQKEQEMIVNGILLDEHELPNNKSVDTSTDKKYVNYYFNIYVDEQIGESILCDSIVALKSNGHRIESEIVCPEADKAARQSIYTSGVLEEDLDSCPD